MESRNIEGEWSTLGNVKLLINPSDEFFISQRQKAQVIEENDLLNSLIPTIQDIQKAETELQIIELLMEVGLI